MKLIIFILLILFYSCIAGNPNGNILESNEHKLKKWCNIMLPLVFDETNDNELIISFYYSCINRNYE